MSKKEILDALSKIGPMTSKELARHIGISRPSITRNLAYLRKAGNKQVYISHYERQPSGTQGMCAAVYKIGCVVDSKKPPKKTSSLVNKDYRKRHAAVLSARRYPDYHKSLGVWGGLL